MNTPDRAPLAYELTIEGAIGPVLRAALAAPGVATQPPCTVIVVEDTDARELEVLLEVLAAADVTVQEIRRLPSPGCRAHAHGARPAGGW